MFGYGLLVMAICATFATAAVWYCIVFPRQPVRGAPPPLSARELALAARLEPHVHAVASRPHNLAYYAELEAAACYIESAIEELGLEARPQVYEIEGRSVRNIEIVFEPERIGAAEATYVVGAHYDSPDDSPGANDNGTGVAALLEIARLLRGLKPRRHRLRLVFFVNEEQPYGKTPDMGSWRHAKQLSDEGERVAGMMALETLGYFSQEPGSQLFPQPFGLIYPDTGNFVAFVGLPGSRAFVHRTVRAFRRHTSFPAIGGVAPGFLPGIDLSDHWAYRQFRFPALMVTDTAPFRNPYYHSVADLPHTVDYPSLARITIGLACVLEALAA
jgi:hypothetical protein